MLLFLLQKKKKPSQQKLQKKPSNLFGDANSNCLTVTILLPIPTATYPPFPVPESLEAAMLPTASIPSWWNSNGAVGEVSFIPKWF